MKETVKQFLTAIGVQPDTITALSAEEMPEGFDMKTAATAFIEKRKELVLNDGEVMKTIKDKFNAEQYPAIVKPLLKRMKDMTGLTSEEMDALKDDGESFANPKKVLEFAIEKMKKSSASTADEIKEQMFALRKQYDEAQEQHNKAIEDLKLGFETERTREKVNKRFNGVVGSNEYVIEKDVAHEILFSRLASRYDFQLTEQGLQPLTKDGNKAADEKGFLTVEEIVKREAEAIKILKKSNGGDGGNGAGSGDGGNNPKFTHTGSGQLSARAAALKAKIEGNK